MSFENALFGEMHGSGFGTGEYLRSFKARPHVSKSKVDQYSNCTYLEAGDFFSISRYKDTDRRYVAATQLSYDTLMSVYDVNTRSMAAARFLNFTVELRSRFERFMRSVKRANFEARIIGMQDGQTRDSVYTVSEFMEKSRLPLFEIDLFGRQLRHIAIDISSGMSYNVLLLDRIYKPGELVSGMTLEQFERSLSGKQSPP